MKEYTEGEKRKMKKRNIFNFLLTMTIVLLTLTLTSCDIHDVIDKIKSPDNQTEDEKPNDHVQNDAVQGLVYDDFQVHFLELGNEYAGDCTYIKAGDTDILIDAGSRKNSATTIKNYVDKYCLDGKLEYVIATHAHQDHIAAFVGSKSGDNRTGIFYQYDVDVLIDFALTETTSGLYGDYLDAKDYLTANGTKCYSAADCWNEKNGAKKHYELGTDMSMDILYNYYYFNDAEDENDYSVCTMFNYKDNHFMMTGDLELEGEQKMMGYYDGTDVSKTLPHVALFKAGHHGSVSSTNECLLKTITPDVVCVCACAGATEYTSNYKNVFPTQNMIDKVAKYTDQIYVTSVFNEKTMDFESMNGNITVSCDGTNVAVAASNNLTKLKDTTWFNETIYYVLDKNNNPIFFDEDANVYYDKDTEGAVAAPRRVWPSYE